MAGICHLSSGDATLHNAAGVINRFPSCVKLTRLNWYSTHCNDYKLHIWTVIRAILNILHLIGTPFLSISSSIFSTYILVMPLSSLVILLCPLFYTTMGSLRHSWQDPFPSLLRLCFLLSPRTMGFPLSSSWMTRWPCTNCCFLPVPVIRIQSWFPVLLYEVCTFFLEPIRFPRVALVSPTFISMLVTKSCLVGGWENQVKSMGWMVFSCIWKCEWWETSNFNGAYLIISANSNAMVSQ